MKKKPALFLLLLVVLLLAAGGWYFRPRSFDATLSRFDPEEPVTACYALIFPQDPEGGHDLLQVEIPVDSDAYQEIMATLRSTTYRRGAGDLLRLGQAAQSHLITLEPYHFFFYLRQGEDLFEWTFYGPNIVATDFAADRDITLVPKGGKAFQQKVVDLLVSLQSPEA